VVFLGKKKIEKVKPIFLSKKNLKNEKKKKTAIPKTAAKTNAEDHVCARPPN